MICRSKIAYIVLIGNPGLPLCVCVGGGGGGVGGGGAS